MADIKKILEKQVELGIYDTIGELYSHSLLESEILFKDFQGQIYENSREFHKEFEALITLWEEKYGFDKNTKIVDVLKVL